MSFYLGSFLNLSFLIGTGSSLYVKYLGPNHIMTVPWNYWTFPIYLIAVDFLFYVQHWMSHKIPILWAGHGPHHSGKKMTASLILRGSFVDGIFGSLIILFPMVIFGFSPFGFFICRQYIFLNQAFCHTEKNWPRFLDFFWVTPRIHRIHHSYSPQHIDRNFGGFLSIWDSIFKTKSYDDKDLRYGLSDGFSSLNPIKICFYLPWELGKTVIKKKSLKYLFVPFTSENASQGSEMI